MLFDFQQISALIAASKHEVAPDLIWVLDAAKEYSYAFDILTDIPELNGIDLKHVTSDYITSFHNENGSNKFSIVRKVGKRFFGVKATCEK